MIGKKIEKKRFKMLLHHFTNQEKLKISRPSKLLANGKNIGMFFQNNRKNLFVKTHRFGHETSTTKPVKLMEVFLYKLLRQERRTGFY